MACMSLRERLRYEKITLIETGASLFAKTESVKTDSAARRCQNRLVRDNKR